MLFEKDFGQAAHTDAADTDKMDMKRFVKVYLIHMEISYLLK